MTILYENAGHYVTLERTGKSKTPTYIVYRHRGTYAEQSGWFSASYPNALSRAMARADALAEMDKHPAKPPAKKTAKRKGK